MKQKTILFPLKAKSVNVKYSMVCHSNEKFEFFSEFTITNTPLKPYIKMSDKSISMNSSSAW